MAQTVSKGTMQSVTSVLSLHMLSEALDDVRRIGRSTLCKCLVDLASSSKPVGVNHHVRAT